MGGAFGSIPGTGGGIFIPGGDEPPMRWEISTFPALESSPFLLFFGFLRCLVFEKDLAPTMSMITPTNIRNTLKPGK